MARLLETLQRKYRSGADGEQMAQRRIRNGKRERARGGPGTWENPRGKEECLERLRAQPCIEKLGLERSTWTRGANA